MLLHQPSLMHSFEGEIQQLLPNSRELSMSSAKTIADILAFAELIDPKSFIGSPFTSQPIYIAACAFLKETAAHTSSQPTSRDISPPKASASPIAKPNTEQTQRHSLLAQAANQNYQCCYKALQQLEQYWAGIRYILVALDQKQSGIPSQNVQTFTAEEYESTKTRADMIPNWRRKISVAPAASPGRISTLAGSPPAELQPGSPENPQAIGWSLTGTTNSPNSNLTFMYQHSNGEKAPIQAPPSSMIYDPIRQNLSKATPPSNSLNYRPYQRQTAMPPPLPKYSETVAISDAEMLVGLQSSPFTQTSTSPYDQRSSPHQPHTHHNLLTTSPSLTTQIYEYPPSSSTTSPSQLSTPSTNHSSHALYTLSHTHHPSLSTSPSHLRPTPTPQPPPTSQQHLNPQNQNQNLNGYLMHPPLPDMMMESQDIDMSTLLVGAEGDFQPWLEYLPFGSEGWGFWGVGAGVNGNGNGGGTEGDVGEGDGGKRGG